MWMWMWMWMYEYCDDDIELDQWVSIRTSSSHVPPSQYIDVSSLIELELKAHRYVIYRILLGSLIAAPPPTHPGALSEGENDHQEIWLYHPIPGSPICSNTYSTVILRIGIQIFVKETGLTGDRLVDGYCIWTMNSNTRGPPLPLSNIPFQIDKNDDNNKLCLLSPRHPCQKVFTTAAVSLDFQTGVPHLLFI